MEKRRFHRGGAGGADHPADDDANGVISMVEMTDYVKKRVPQITGGKQDPEMDLRFTSDVFVAGL